MVHVRVHRWPQLEFGYPEIKRISVRYFERLIVISKYIEKEKKGEKRYKRGEKNEDERKGCLREKSDRWKKFQSL